MATEHNSSEKLIDPNQTEELAYENKSFVADLPSDQKVNDLGSVISSKKVATKWSHLVNKRRVTRQFSGSRADFIVTFANTGLDDEIMQNKIDDQKQARLNKQLISYFVSLAKHNDNDDEVDLNFIEDLIRQGADINARDRHGQGVLHEIPAFLPGDEAVWLCTLPVVVSLLIQFSKIERNKLVKMFSFFINELLEIQAARAWHTDILQFLKELGADINMTDKLHRTPLHVAAAVNYPEMVETLIDKGANLEAVTKEENQTPLHFAARNDASESLKVLVKLGADLEAKDYKQRTPIFVAAELDRSETAKHLIDMNADVTAVDNSGLMCMTHMITKMGPVARNALDQYHKKDRANRKQYFFLELLEAPVLENGKEGKALSLAKTPLEVIVNYRQLDIIMHPVIMRLIEVKWNRFGRRIAIRTLIINILFVLTWTILGVSTRWYLRPFYTFPQDGWRVFLWVLGCSYTAYEVFAEVKEILNSRQKFKAWKAWREKNIDEDMMFCHPKWPEEKKYLEREKETLDDMLPTYFQDFWNYFDWIVYFLVFFNLLLHIIDASITGRTAPCCTLEFVCNDSSTSVCDTGLVNNANLSVWSNRFFVVLIIFLWLRLMKFTRAFRFFGPFIVMLGKLTWDIFRFLYLYLEFYIPYSCAFWMIFGNNPSITTMQTVDQMLFSLFRITLVDDYQFQEMQTFDIVMAYILIGTFLGISAILCLNLFIALLSDTFQRVYDNANANAVMQQAALLLNFEDNLSEKSKKRFRKFLKKKCNPEVLYYDDDLTVAQDADLKKVTIKIKEQMDELLGYVHQEERKSRTNDEDDFSSPRGGKMKSKGSAGLSDVLGLMKNSKKSGNLSETPSDAMNAVSGKLTEFTTRMQRLQASQTTQDQANKKLREDLKQIKDMLSILVPGYQPPPSSDSKLFAAPALSLRSLTQQVTNEKKNPLQPSEKSTGIFKRMMGGQKTNKKSVTPEEEATSLPHFVPLAAFQAPPAGGELTSMAGSPAAPTVGLNVLSSTRPPSASENDSSNV